MLLLILSFVVITVLFKQVGLLLLDKAQVPQQLKLIRVLQRQLGVILILQGVARIDRVVDTGLLVMVQLVVRLKLLLILALQFVDIVLHDAMSEQLLVGLMVHKSLIRWCVDTFEHLIDDRVTRYSWDPLVITTC